MTPGCMLRIMAIVAAWALAAPAGAQALYKCSDGGQISYTDQPCSKGKLEQLAVPAAPPVDPNAGRALQRQKAQLKSMQKQRRAREAKDQAAQVRQARGAAKQRKRCAKLRLDKKWADENFAKAAGLDKEPLRQKARRKAELLALECAP